MNITTRQLEHLDKLASKLTKTAIQVAVAHTLRKDEHPLSEAIGNEHQQNLDNYADFYQALLSQADQ